MQQVQQKQHLSCSPGAYRQHSERLFTKHARACATLHARTDGPRVFSRRRSSSLTRVRPRRRVQG
jgi:hypothetical protein